MSMLEPTNTNTYLTIPELPEQTSATADIFSNPDFVSQIANELYIGAPAVNHDFPVITPPVASGDFPLPVSGIPANGIDTIAPITGNPPTYGESALEGTIGSAPAIPDISSAYYLPVNDGIADSYLNSSTPDFPVNNIPVSYSAGAVPSVGEGKFLSDIPHGIDACFPQTFNGIEQPSNGQMPYGEADIIRVGINGLSGIGIESPTENVSQFYFLPATNIKVAPDNNSKVRFDANSVRRDFPALHQNVNGKPLIWLDNAATTHKPQSMIDAVAHFYAHDNSNIHRGAHALAARATDAFESAREKVRILLGAKSKSEIIFTRNATESINLVAQSYGRKNIGPGDEIIVTTLEHHSNIVPWQFLCQQTGAVLKVAPIDDHGQVIIEEYERLLNSRTKLVSFAHVSNVLGTVLPVNIMIQMAHRYGAKVLVDGAQGAPHLPVNVRAYDADFYVFSGHKLFGPTGIGVLYGKEEILEYMPPWQGGGSMIESVSFEDTTFSPLPAKFEAGTPHIAGAVGLGASIDYLNRYGLESIAAYEDGLMAYGISELSTIPGLRHIGTTPGKVGALAFVIDGIPSEKIGKFLDSEGIAVRAGHHCAQPALARFGLKAAVRPSISLYNTTEDIDQLIVSLNKALRSI